MSELDVARAAIAREWRRASDLLRHTPDAGWSAQTRCAKWSLADLVAHGCWGTSFEADGLRRARTGSGGVAEGDDGGGDLAPDVLRARLAAGSDALVGEMDAFIAQPHERAVPMPYGELPIPLAFEVFTMEAGLHTSDIAAAIGEDDRLEPDVCRAALRFLEVFGSVMVDPDAAGLDQVQTVGLRCSQGGVRFVLGDGQGTVDRLEATTTISGDDSDVILFAFGRHPLGNLEVEGDQQLAARFKDFVAGP